MKSRRLIAAVSAIAIASGSAGTSAAMAAPPALMAGTATAVHAAVAAAAARAHPSSSAPGYRRLCALPKPGQAACDALVRTGVRPSLTMKPGDTQFGYAPQDLWHAYRIAAAARSKGSGRIVALVDGADDPNAEADLAVYRKQFGLPPCTTANRCFLKVNQNGSPNPATLPAPDDGWAGEISLDVDMVSAICPLCRILLVEAKNPDFHNLAKSVNTAVRLGARYVSNSYGGPEQIADKNLELHYYLHPGTVITASTGDNGFGVEFPAASPFVTAVGGTSLRHARNRRGWTESVWGSELNPRAGGTGSGCSLVEPKPPWQRDTGCHQRTVADVSADADPQTGVVTFDTFGNEGQGFAEIGGTSASAPMIAAMYALAGKPRARTLPVSYLYLHRRHLFDVTTGSNGSCLRTYLCHGTAGYDGPTGLGTPDGLAAFRP